MLLTEARSEDSSDAAQESTNPLSAQNACTLSTITSHVLEKNQGLNTMGLDQKLGKHKWEPKQSHHSFTPQYSMMVRFVFFNP